MPIMVSIIIYLRLVFFFFVDNASILEQIVLELNVQQNILNDITSLNSILLNEESN